MASMEIYHVSETGQTVSHTTELEFTRTDVTVDITPDTKGLLRWIRHVAETDRLTATRILVDGGPMSPEQAEAILDEGGN